jgi:hypothetical protein
LGPTLPGGGKLLGAVQLVALVLVLGDLMATDNGG